MLRDVYAAGRHIVSTGNYKCSSIGTNPDFKVSKYTGTSQASPQVAGMCALYLQANPTATPQQVKDWIVNSANKNNLASAGSVDDYGNPYSLLGTSAGVAYLQIVENTTVGKSYAKDITGNWKQVNRKYVKQSSAGWTEIQAGYIKTASGWKQNYKKGA